MKTMFIKYRMLDGKERRLLKQIGDGRVIRLFNKTPYPEKDTDVICPHFYELAAVYGCPYNCAYCYLKGTFRFFQADDGRIPVRLKKERQVRRAITRFLQISRMGQVPPTVLNTGELTDSLCTERSVFYGKPLSKYLMQFFEGSKHKILFLSKGINVKNFLENDWQKNVILSWSLNAYPVAERWEHMVPRPRARIDAAKKVAEADYDVRIRIDPMVAVEDFEEHYQTLVSDLLDALTPTRITLGCLRGLASTMARAVDKSWIRYLAEESSWGRKPPAETRFSLYANIIDYLRENGYEDIEVGVCKDTLEMWKMLKKQYGLDYRKMKCNCVW